MDVLETDLKATKRSEEKKKNMARTVRVRMPPVHLGFVVRGHAGYGTAR